MKISLIIPAYNEEKYISSCLEYALCNGGPLLHEIIVIDNASSDATVAIAEKYLSAYPHLRIITETRKGVTRARERGYTESTGDILAFIDADTRMPAGWVQQIKQEFNKDTDLGFLTGPYDYYDMTTIQHIASRFYWRFLVYPLSLVIGYIGVGGNFAIRKEILDKMNGFDTDIEFYGDDTDTARRAKRYSRVKYSLGFVMPTSARRFMGNGSLRTVWVYVKNFISIVFYGKPATRQYTDFR